MLTRHQGLAYLILTSVVEVCTDVSSCLLLECRFPSSSRGRKKTSEMQTWLGLRWVLHTEQHSERMAFAVLCHWVKKTWKAELQHKRTTWEQMLMKGEGRFYFPGSFILSSQRHLLWGRKDASAVQKRKKINQIFPVSMVLYLCKSQAKSKGVPITHSTQTPDSFLCYYHLAQGCLLLWLLQLLNIIINWSP